MNVAAVTVGGGSGLSFISVGAEVMAAAAADLATIGSNIAEADACAAASITGVIPAAEDEVSTAIAGLFGLYAGDFRNLSAQAAAFHSRLVQGVNVAAQAYTFAEASNTSALQTAAQDVLDVMEAPARPLLGHWLFGGSTGASTSVSSAIQAVAAEPLAVGTTLVMGGSGDPFPSTSFLNTVNNLFIQVTPGLEGSVVKALCTPEQFYPFGGPNELTLSASVSQGVHLLDSALQPYIGAGTPVGVFGYSQSAIIASLEMQSLQAAGVPSSAVHFMLIGDLMNPNGGMFERFAGLQLPSLGMNFYGATPSNAYPTTVYTMEYDGWADFPRYPLDILSDLNVFLSPAHFEYPELTGGQISSAIPLTTSGATQTAYYIIPTTGLPLLDPVRGNIPIFGDAIADLLQPDLTYLVNLGYGDPLYGWSTSPANVPTPAGLFPPLSAFQELPGLLASGAQHGVQNFISDLTGTGPNPVAWPSLNPSASLLASSSGTVSATSALIGPMTAFSTAMANPATAIPNYLNTLSGDLSNAYGALLPSADILEAAVLSVPAYDVSLFSDGIMQALNGQPVTGLINAVGMPLAVDTELYLLLGQFEYGVVLDA